jgi:hypothetical protein
MNCDGMTIRELLDRLEQLNRDMTRADFTQMKQLDTERYFVREKIDKKFADASKEGGTNRKLLESMSNRNLARWCFTEAPDVDGVESLHSIVLSSQSSIDALEEWLKQIAPTTQSVTIEQYEKLKDNYETLVTKYSNALEQLYRVLTPEQINEVAKQNSLGATFIKTDDK